MTDSSFFTYKSFTKEDDLLEFVEFLKGQNIEFEVENNSLLFDPSFVNSDLSKDYRIKLRKPDFEKVNALLNEMSEQQMDDVDEDYYLFSFANEELIEILSQQDKWGHFDYVLARKILTERGIHLSEEQIEDINKSRIKELSQPEESQKNWIVVGYLFSFLGGLIGIFIGRHLMTHQKTLPDGSSIFAYSAADRKHGKYIFTLGCLMLVIWILFKLYRNN